ncbi:MAG: right-handed parallel beta-helix repeat-containing protein [Planctomycetes bacterium]|nr:right-handed parallel beta-helix repeat-containing protein [Planctomycetota bacterium]
MNSIWRRIGAALALIASWAPSVLCAQEQAEVVVIDRDDVRIERSCTVDPSGMPIADANGDGVLHIVGDNITVAFSRTALNGADASTAQDQLRGVGIRITGKNVVLRGAQVQGFKTAVWASGADGLVVEGCTFSNNYAQRLRSTLGAEDPADWLWPHKNDGGEWRENYGAAVYVERSKGVTLRLNSARRGQNGICLSRVDDSFVFDNDMSFLSGWGLALHRSSRNVVDHNSFDFCNRGYSHGVYSRGQDSAGILAFEQCSDNLFAFNSATHGGDGFFGFAGLEALEGAGVEHKGLGCNRNVLHGNDFSYAAAIGIELTFSFDNLFQSNRLVGGNYGVWGGYSHNTRVLDNTFAENTLSALAVEHGDGLRVEGNRFERNARAIELWWDEDADLASKPWVKANGSGSRGAEVGANEFREERLALELRGGASARWLGGEGLATAVDERSRLERVDALAPLATSVDPRLSELRGTRAAVGARAALAGRERILVTEWGPYDWTEPLLWRAADEAGAHVYELLGMQVAVSTSKSDSVRLKVEPGPRSTRYVLSARKAGAVTPYEFRVRLPARELAASGLLVDASWSATFGAWSSDPRTDAAAWRAEVERGVRCELRNLSFPFGGGGPSELVGAPQAVREARLPHERFGLVAATKLELPAGAWRVTTHSDDGVRVRIDGATLLENWTHHGPTRDQAQFEVAATRVVAIEVEYFELDGHAVLEFALEPAPPRAGAK